MKKTHIAHSPHPNDAKPPHGTARAAAAALIEQWCKTKPIADLQPARAARLMCQTKTYTGKYEGLQTAIRELKIERMKDGTK